MKVLNNSCLRLSYRVPKLAAVSGSATDVSERKLCSSRSQTHRLACAMLLYAPWITAVDQAGGTDMYVHMYIVVSGVKISFQKSNTKQIKPTPQLALQFAIRQSSSVRCYTVPPIDVVK
jgi:hypothetical protein